MTRRIIVPRRLGVGVVAAVFGGLLLAVATEVPASAADRPVHEHNLCGHACPSPPGQSAPAAVVAGKVNASSPTPILLFLNEICVSQYNYLSQTLVGTLAPYRKFITTRVAALNDPACGDFGNAVFGIGNPWTPTWFQYANQSAGSTCSVTATECRRIMCVKFSGQAPGAFVGCVSHLSPTASMARLQAPEALGKLNSWYTTDRRIFGGDLNLTPAP